MRIVLIGCGTVGSSIAEQLVMEGHNVTLVDSDGEILKSLSGKCDTIGVEGDGTDVSVLRKAGVDKADLVLCITAKDEVNILCCGAAAKLGAKNTVARVRNAAYGEYLQLLKQDLKLAMVINPDLATAKALYRILYYSAADNVETFYRGRVELVEFPVMADSVFCGKTLYELRSSLKCAFLVCGVLRKGKMTIPSGDFTLMEGDMIGVTASHGELVRLFKTTGLNKHPVRNLLITGGSALTEQLLALLEDTRMSVTVIEPDKALCDRLIAEYECTVLHADSGSHDVLLEEGIEDTDAFLALSESDEANILASMFAKSKTTGKVITKINDFSYAQMLEAMDYSGVVTPNAITSDDILHFVRAKNDDESSEIEALHRIMGDQAEAIEFLVRKDIEGLTEIPLKELKLQKGVLIACIARNNKIIIPSGDSEIRRGDTVIVITTDEKQLTNIKDMIAK